ncbi:MAG: dTMP kinase [Vulcanisaeta sp.]|jgi:dTMP kinase|uniref:Probable thymidylate kinase n=1 Tax=Vulcanisaeta moutnovskia (strain 768-28) TaxID=985053 RepID=F0QSU2_VULM7|nr:dTMP kinase [Vulcanisaeta moutnovskia]ADY00363.1 thymidylate kinase [Vulcanisaeta moutnovskia 768-28]
MFVAVEGIDGVGKSTVISMLRKKLESNGYRVYTTAEPSQSPIGRLIRDWLLKPSSNAAHPSIFALLFTADRVQHYYGEVKPKLDSGYLVITERYMESTLAYQGAMGLPQEWLMELHRFVPRPDLTIILDAPIETVIGRLSNRRELEVFEVNKEFLSKVREFLLRRASTNNYPVINADRDLESIVNDIYELIIDALRRVI